MKLTSIEVTAFELTDVAGLDPIRIFLQDFGAGKGRITVECYGRAWSTFWGAMSVDIVTFVTKVDSDYIAGAMSQGTKMKKQELEYLERIIVAVQAALRQHVADAAMQAATRQRVADDAAQAALHLKHAGLCPIGATVTPTPQVEVNEHRAHIAYRWWRADKKPISTAHISELDAHAVARAAKMTAEGFTSGELCENISMTEQDTEDGVEYAGWWEVSAEAAAINMPSADRDMAIHVCRKLYVVLGLNDQERAWLETLGAKLVNSPEGD